VRYFECFNTLGFPGSPGKPGPTGATGPRGRKVNEVNTDCEGPVGEYRYVVQYTSTLYDNVI